MGAWIMVEKLGHDESQVEKKTLKVKLEEGLVPEQKGDQAIFYA